MEIRSKPTTEGLEAKFCVVVVVTLSQSAVLEMTISISISVLFTGPGPSPCLHLSQPLPLPTSKFMQPVIQLIFRNTETDSHLYFLGTSFWFRWRYFTGRRCRKNCSRKKDQSENRRDKQSGIICLVHSVNATVDLKLPRSWRVVLVALIKLARDISIMTIGGAATLQNPSQFSDIIPSWDLPGEVSVDQLSDQLLDKLQAAKRSIWLCIISI